MVNKFKKVEFRTPYSESVLEGTFEAFTRPSLTEPDNSMSIPEIIAKYTRGQGIQVQQHPWDVGEASEDGFTVGDGIDTEGFLRFGIPQELQEPQEPQESQELQEPQEPQESQV